MKVIKKYRYNGVNGILTTRILLEGIDHSVFYELIADSGKLLTNGIETVRFTAVREQDINKWVEFNDPEAKSNK